MIEISHKQAQHLIREGQDRRLPEEQWAVLYSHLESCPECRAYQQRLTNYERDLHRALQARWSATRGPAEGVAAHVINFRSQRKRTAKFLRKASLYLFGLILLAGYLTFRQVTAPPPQPTSTPDTITAAVRTPTPIPLQTMFYGLVLFETRRDGNAEIYLLKASPDGPQLTNLTQNPAQDTRPAWSPDGEWIAFLSDRTGKNEIHIMHVAGSRLTQVTNVPGIEWIGPLEWSYDGKWLGLAGRRGGQNGPSFLYLVPLDGSGEPRSIAFTFNAGNHFHFSPAQSALAYLTNYRSGGIDVVNIDNGWTGAVTLEDNQALHFLTGQEAAFDWSLGGRSLVYAADPEAAGTDDRMVSSGSQIRLSPEIEIYSHQDFTGAGAKTVDALESPHRFRAVSWVPHSLMVAGLAGGYSGPGDCWMVRLSNAYNSAQSPRVLPELCVVGGLSQANWTPDGKWLVVVARKPDEQTPALYAIRLPDVTGREDTSRENTLAAGVTHVERLVDLPAEDLPALHDLTGYDLFAEPRVRPGGPLLRFTPRAVSSPETVPGPGSKPGEAPGWIVYSVQQGADSWIEKIRPDGSGYQLLTGYHGEHSCPRISPEGQRIAYLSDRSSSRRGVNEVVVMDMDGKNPLLLTREAFPKPNVLDYTTNPLPRYDCPVWSPDGKLLAAIHRTVDQVYLAVIPVDGKGPAKYLLIEPASHYSSPVWIPFDASHPSLGANQILLVYPRAGQSSSTSVVRVDVDESQDRQPAKVATRMPMHGWDDIQELALSPDGQQIAMFLFYQNLTSDLSYGRTTAVMSVLDLATMNTLSETELPNYRAEITGMESIAWLPDGKISLARIDHLVGPRKTVFERFDPFARSEQANLEPLGHCDEVTYKAKWMEGRWTVFSTESGLWIMDLEEAQATGALPVSLINRAVADFDWQ